MSLPFNRLYEFGEFRLDPKEKILTRAGEPVELTPKGFELLSLFVENHGRLLEKDELMDRIWTDSFVEESNLTFNIRQLRKILGDDAHAPRYIKTVRRHGYRFIAEVREISETEETPDRGYKEKTIQKIETISPVITQPAEIIITEKAAPPLPKNGKFPLTVFATAAFLLIAAAAIGSWYVRSRNIYANAPVLSSPFNTDKISTNGKVAHAVLSPDGKNVVYSNGTRGDKKSLWLRQLETGNNVEIIPPGDFFYAGLAFSPDGNFIYFVRKPRGHEEQTNIYRMSIFGGVPEKIIDETQGWISLSPDGARISFVRCYYREEEYCSLWIADAADGKNERKLVVRPQPFRIRGNKISPDGKTIAFAVGQSENASNEFGIREVDLESGAERELSSERFFNIGRIEWLPGGLGWLITASRNPNRNSGIWQISATTGEAVLLTKDSEVYGALSLDQKASKIVTTIVRKDFHLRLVSAENPQTSRILSDAGNVSYAPDGKIYFSSILSGNAEIWSIGADGSNQRQLTNSTADEDAVLASPDGKSVFFASNRTGAAQIWRMDTDGSNHIQITQQEGGFPLFVSPDGEWLYYQHSMSRTIWRVAAKGGAVREQMVLNKSKSFFAISPDAALAAFSERQGDERILTVVSLESGQIFKTFRLADPRALLLNIVWMPDRKSLAYITSDLEYENNTLWLQPLDGEAPRRFADLGDEELSGFGLSVSPDGKSFAVVQGEWLHDAVLLKGLR